MPKAKMQTVDGLIKSIAKKTENDNFNLTIEVRDGKIDRMLFEKVWHGIDFKPTDSERTPT